MIVSTAPELIVALDVPTCAQAVALVERLRPLDVLFKVGYESLYGYGDELRAALERLQTPYFIDAKLHDIPRTVAAGVRALVRPGVRIINVHALGGNDMMQAAVEAADERARCAGVVCSTHEATDLKAYFGADFKTLCPGIRPLGSSHGDQKRVATPRDAVLAGADYLVVGRPIVEAPDPLDAARAVLAEMESAHAI
jgi:orotidine-5'-phosphate decarboxylase